MVETIKKATLLEKVKTAYEHLNTLLATLNEEQKTTPGVNSSWSVKDNVAHITAYQDLLPDRIQSLIAGKPPAEFLPEFKTEEEVNEYLYQQNKDRPLAEVEAAFQISYQRAFAAVESLSEQDLARPVPGSPEWPIWRYIEGEICEHYEEHSNLIRRWLDGAPHKEI
ncbi:MAG: ClbS/DfsB family four-helix bundle protein [Ktedonobacteraceae bacterium]|nr:ClbS/DfsB family four-helix bundle protein [Ktedonobacteraceae bacterium]